MLSFAIACCRCLYNSHSICLIYLLYLGACCSHFMKINRIALATRLITFSSSCCILRASDICVDCAQLIMSLLEYMLNQNQNRNGNGNQKQIQLAGNLKGSSVSTSVSVSLFSTPPRRLTNSSAHYEVGASFLLDLSSEFCKEGRLKYTLALLYFQCFAITFFQLLLMLLLLQVKLSAIARVCGVFYAAHTCSQAAEAAPAWQFWVAGSTNSHIIYIVIGSVTFIWSFFLSGSY